MWSCLRVTITQLACKILLTSVMIRQKDGPLSGRKSATDVSRSGTGSQEYCTGASLLLAKACSAASTSWRRALCCSHSLLASESEVHDL